MSADADKQVIEEFRVNRGQVGGPYEGTRLLLLTTTKASTGEPRTTPVGYLPDGGFRMLVIAAADGISTPPGWYHDLLAHPIVTVETGVLTCQARATALAGEERDLVFARAAEADPRWADRQRATEEVIPVVALAPISGGLNGASLGESLLVIHGAFRRELALIRKEVAESGPGLGTQLRINCLTMCEGLHQHHSLEDGALFPALGRHHPELAATLTRLGREHQTIKRLVDDLQALVSSCDAEPAVLLTEVERLTAEVEAHLDYEEAQLLPILDGLAPG